MKRRDFIKLGAGLGAALTAAPRPARAQAKDGVQGLRRSTSRLSDGGGDRKPRQKLADSTNGRLSVQMFPSMQLGGEKETIEQTQIGAIQLLRVSAGANGTGRRRDQRHQHAVPVQEHRARRTR